MRLHRFLLAFILLTTAAFAQSTAVTLQVTDGDGQTWNNGTWTVNLVTAPGFNPGPPFVIKGTNTPVPGQTQSGSLSGTGGASLTLTPNASIAPAGSAWYFVVCPNATSDCYRSIQSIAGASQNVNLAPPAIRLNGGYMPLNARAYADGEILSPPQGAQYFNVTTLVERFFNGTVWGTIGSGNGSVNNGTTGQVGYYPANGNTINGDACTTDGSGHLICTSLATGGVGTGTITSKIGTAPTAPASGFGTLYIDNSDNSLRCLLNGGGSCLQIPTIIQATNNGLVCDGTTNDTTAFNNLLTAIGSNQSSIQFPEAKQCLVGTVTVPTNVALDFTPGGALKIVTAAIFTIKGGVDNPDNHQIFFNANSGTTGTVDFTGNTQITTVYPEWWGAVVGAASPSTNTIALQNAIYGAYGCGPVIACRTNPSNNFKWNKVLYLNGNYTISGTLNMYHVINFKFTCNARLNGGITQGATNARIINGQSVAYGEFSNCSWSTNQSQNLSNPLVVLDYDGSQGVDIKTQFVDFTRNLWSGNNLAAIGFQLSPSGGGAQGSNINFDNNGAKNFTEACYMIGAGSGGTPTSLATNAISIIFEGGDIQGCTAYGIENFGGGQILVNGTTMENNFNSQTGYDFFCSSSPAGEQCSMRDVRSESLFMFGGNVNFNVDNSFMLDSAYVPSPGNTPSVGDVIQGSLVGGHGVYYKVSVAGGAFSGLGTSASPRSATGGSATTLIDSVGGLTVNAWTGWYVTIWSGTGVNAYCLVTSNTANTFTCTGGWLTDLLGTTTAFTPDATTRYFVEPAWGTQFTSGGVTWAALNRLEGGGTCHLHNVFIPGEQLNCGGFSVLEGVQVTRADWAPTSGGFPLDNLATQTHFDGVMAGITSTAGAGIGILSNCCFRSYNFRRNGITGLSSVGVDQKGSIPIGWAMGQAGGGVATVDLLLGPNPNAGNTNGSLDIQNNSSGTNKIWKFQANGSSKFPGFIDGSAGAASGACAFPTNGYSFPGGANNNVNFTTFGGNSITACANGTQTMQWFAGSVNVLGAVNFGFSGGKGQHFFTQAANNDVVGTCTAAAATTCVVTFTTAYNNAPVCVATDQTNITTLKVTPTTTTLTITTTAASSDVFAYNCVGNPN